MHNIHTYTDACASVDNIHQMNIYRIMIQLYISQVMDGQIYSKTLNNILENDMISLSHGSSDTYLLGLDLDINSHEDIHTMKPFSILNQLPGQPTNPPFYKHHHVHPILDNLPHIIFHDHHHSTLHHKHH